MDLAQRIFPCFDQNDLKAPVTLTVTAPEGWRVVANGLAAGEQGGTWTFATTPPIPLPMFTVCAGPWHSVTLGARRPRRAGAALRVARPRLARGPARPRRRRADPGHRVLLRPLRSPVRRAVRVRLLRPGVRAGPQLGRPREPRLRDLPRRDPPGRHAHRGRAPPAGHDHRPRDGPPVVRQPHHHDLVGGHLAAGVVRRLHGLPGRRRRRRLHRRPSSTSRSGPRCAPTPPTSAAPPTRWRRCPRRSATSTRPATTSTRSPTPRATRCSSSW